MFKYREHYPVGTTLYGPENVTQYTIIDEKHHLGLRMIRLKNPKGEISRWLYEESVQNWRQNGTPL